VIDPINTSTREWRTIETWAQDKIKVAQAVLENPQLDDRMTSYHRGRINALRALLALGNPTPEPTPDGSPGQGA